MKAMQVVLIGKLIAGCGWSAEQITATTEAAQAQTETAALTLTAAPPDRHLKADKHTDPSDHRGESRPHNEQTDRIPINITSAVVRTTAAGFTFKILQELPDDAVILIYLENPDTPRTAIPLPCTSPFETTLLVMSDPLG